MNYVIIDLEWNQSPLGRETKIKELPFEIIEIGAVKLDSNKNVTGEFHAFIKPQVYQEIHFRTQEIIHININDLEKGVSFEKVIGEFFKWCGTCYRFCTWGPMDLTELQRNMSYYHITGYIDKPVIYYDIQKLFSLHYEGRKNPRTLEYAVDFLSLKKEEKFHRALYDAKYTAAVFKSIDEKVIEEYYSLDYYQNPKKKAEEIYLIYENYTKFISMEYSTKEQVINDKDVKETVCFRCGRKASKKVKWFSGNSKIYYCLAYCKEHGYIRGKIRIKKTALDKVFAVKTLKLVDIDAAEEIRIMQEEVKIRKQQKKNKKCQ